MTTNAQAAAETGAEQWQHQAARRIADELRGDPHRGRMAKVSSLLHAFRGPGTHTDIRAIKRALQGQGIVAQSGSAEISRRDVLAMRLEGEPTSTAMAPSLGIRVSRWRLGVAGRDVTPLEAQGLADRGSDEVLWFDVDPLDNGLPADQVQQRVDEVTAQLEPWCPQLQDVIVRDLLTADVQPKIETYGSERTGVRSVSVAAMVAREVTDEDDEFDGVDEQLIIQMVEIVVGPGWIITCWHPCRTLVGSGDVHNSPPLVREPFLSHVAHRWVHDTANGAGHEGRKGSGDLGLYLARSLVATYGASLRMLQRWVSTWEVAFYKALGHEDTQKGLKDAAVEISNFLSMVGEFSRSVSAFQLAGEEMPNKTWFVDSVQRSGGATNERVPHDHAEALASSIQTAVEKLRHLSDEIRADMDLLMIQSQARQQESSERLQGYLGKVTGLVLVPTFVAGLFGANTALPGGGSWTGFEIMLVLMAISAVASYLLIRKVIKS